MALACPVCDSLAPDREHLAHHLAIVAMTRGGEHETWLDDTAAGWRNASPEALGATVIEHVETVEHELADRADGDRPEATDGSHRRDASVTHGGGAGGGASRPNPAGDEETAAVLAEAREITQRMLGADDGPGAGAGDGTDGPGVDDDNDRLGAGDGNDEPGAGDGNDGPGDGDGGPGTDQDDDGPGAGTGDERGGSAETDSDE